MDDSASGCMCKCSANHSIAGARVLLNLAQHIINPDANPLNLVGNNSDMQVNANENDILLTNLYMHDSVTALIL